RALRTNIFALIVSSVAIWQAAAWQWGRPEMDSEAFATWLVGIRRLDASQRSRAFQELALAEANGSAAFQRGESVETTLAVEAKAKPSAVRESAVNATPEQSLLSQVGQGRLASFGCPHCGGDDIRSWGKANGKPRYRCVNCRKTQARALISGETIAKAAARCGVDYTTAFRWRHRFLEALNRDKPASLSGIVEADETFILESFKGKRRGLPRAARNEAVKPASVACRRSKSRSWWRVTGRARPSMPGCHVATPPASRRPWARSSKSPRNCAVTAGQPSRRSRGAPR